MRRAERRRADHEGQAARTLWEIDYLLTVNDEARQCPLLFAEREWGSLCVGSLASALSQA